MLKYKTDKKETSNSFIKHTVIKGLKICFVSILYLKIIDTNIFLVQKRSKIYYD